MSIGTRDTLKDMIFSYKPIHQNKIIEFSTKNNKKNDFLMLFMKSINSNSRTICFKIYDAYKKIQYEEKSPIQCNEIPPSMINQYNWLLALCYY